MIENIDQILNDLNLGGIVKFNRDRSMVCLTKEFKELLFENYKSIRKRATLQEDLIDVLLQAIILTTVKTLEIKTIDFKNEQFHYPSETNWHNIGDPEKIASYNTVILSLIFNQNPKLFKKIIEIKNI